MNFPCFARIIILSLLLLPSQTAWAVQGHGGAEGLVIHQLGHILFVAGIVVLLYYIRRNRLTNPGWRRFTLFFRLLLAWNGLAFTSHWLHEVVNQDHLIRNHGRLTGITINNLTGLAFYLSSLDHILLVPAFFLLLQALSHWEKNQ